MRLSMGHYTDHEARRLFETWALVLDRGDASVAHLVTATPSDRLSSICGREWSTKPGEGPSLFRRGMWPRCEACVASEEVAAHGLKRAMDAAYAEADATLAAREVAYENEELWRHGVACARAVRFALSELGVPQGADGPVRLVEEGLYGAGELTRPQVVHELALCHRLLRAHRVASDAAP